MKIRKSEYATCIIIIRSNWQNNVENINIHILRKNERTFISIITSLYNLISNPFHNFHQVYFRLFDFHKILIKRTALKLKTHSRQSHILVWGWLVHHKRSRHRSRWSRVCQVSAIHQICCHLVSSSGNNNSLLNQIYLFTFKCGQFELIIFQIKQ